MPYEFLIHHAGTIIACVIIAAFLKLAFSDLNRRFL